MILMVVAQTYMAALSHAQSPNMIGSWKVDITFTNGESRSLRFDAQGAGKGSFLLLDPRLKVWGPAKPSVASWTQGEGNSVTFSGPVEFLLGNVGRDAGTLVFKGKFETDGSIRGEVEFSPLVGSDRRSTARLKPFVPEADKNANAQTRRVARKLAGGANHHLRS